MHIISQQALRQFWERHPDAEESLRAWYTTVQRAQWTKPVDITADYRSARFVGHNRVVFSIKGNYRLIALVDYNKDRLFIRFVGTLAEYDQIDAEIV